MTDTIHKVAIITLARSSDNLAVRHVVVRDCTDEQVLARAQLELDKRKRLHWASIKIDNQYRINARRIK